VEYRYLFGGACSIKSTTIYMNGFNPNFVVIYESGNSIKIKFNNFTTDSKICFMQKHFLGPSDQDNLLPV